METLVDHIIATLRTAKAGEPAHNEALLDAAFYFERARGMQELGMGWSKAVLAARITNTDTARLKTALVEYVQQGGDALFSLSKCDDPKLKGVFIQVLRRMLDGDAGQLYQAMIGLENLGERPFQDRRSKSILDVEENRRSARQYLSDLDKMR